jgi:2-phosphoglycerate kinase
MAKFVVIDSEQNTEVPFLRGILIRSLQDAGLAFDEAHQLASEIRDDLSESGFVSTRKLRATVLKRLRNSPHESVLQRYQAGRTASLQVVVEYENGLRAPFSRGYHQRRLEACAIGSDEANALTQTLYKHLLDKGKASIRAHHLDGLTYACLDHDVGPAVAHRYLVWTDFVRSGRPLVLLIGGTAGCGKSTTATNIANRLEIVRTQSTDMLREVMRMMTPKRLLPGLHTSSFEAWKALPGVDPERGCNDAQLADGFHAQAELLSVACEGVVQRALRERVSLILEGVHICPSLLEKISGAVAGNALVVPVMLAVLDPGELKKRIRGRGGAVPQRRAERYLKSFDAIWRLQSVLLDEADGAHVPIFENNDKDKVYREVMRHIIGVLSDDFSRKPADVFKRRPLDSGAARPKSAS